MAAPLQHLDPAVVARIQGLELRARTIVEGYVAGLHRSPHQGFSVEFAEHREYVPGDDLRYVDWKVFGKSDRIYLKQFVEETNFVCHLLVDSSESMDYRSETAALSKLEYARAIAAALSYVVIRQQDAVGLATFDHEIKDVLRPSAQPSQFANVCRLLERRPAGEATSIGPILHELAERIRRRGLVFVVSDLFDDVGSVLNGLKHFRHRRHDVTLLQIVDPAEQDFPFDSPTLFRGLEGMPEQTVDGRSLRKAYRREFESFLQSIRRGCRDLAIDHVLLRTDEPLDVALSRLLVQRMRRV